MSWRLLTRVYVVPDDGDARQGAAQIREGDGMTVMTVAVQGLTSLERDLAPIDDGFMAYWNADAAARRRMYRAARATMREHRASFGFSDVAPLMTRPESQPKLEKSSKRDNVRTLSLMLTPYRGAFGNACPAASAGCAAGCLNTSGKGDMPGVQYARMVRMAFLVMWPWESGVILAHEWCRELASHGDTRLGFRPNCVSDIRWERVTPGMLVALIDAGVSVYDYTAFRPGLRDGRPDGYTLTYSAKETHDDAWIAGMVAAGHNVAVPVHVKPSQDMPATWRGLPAIDGDVSDWRPGDPTGVVVLLRAKGRARGDRSGFVRSL